ncbi:MAG: hypothetical protein ACRCY4_06915, partial [Brevinema sp.]
KKNSSQSHSHDIIKNQKFSASLKKFLSFKFLPQALSHSAGRMSQPAATCVGHNLPKISNAFASLKKTNLTPSDKLKNNSARRMSPQILKQ